MKIIDDFILKNKNNSKTALIFKRNHRWVKKSFNEFLNDVFKMNNLIKTEVEDDNILIFSYPYTYEFYVTAFSVILSGKNLVIIDSFKDIKKVKAMLNMSSTKTIICDHITKLMTFIFPRNIKRINANKFKKYSPLESFKDSGRVTTFTSGTTGMPKMICRDISFLFYQMETIKNNIEFNENELLYALLPMYSIMSLFLGYSTVINKDPGAASKFNPTALITTIRSIQQIKKPMESIKRAFIGGAILYSKESVHLQNNLPNAEVTYVYGASESAMIYKTTVRKYIKNPFTFDEKIDGVAIEIANPDENGVGEIIVKGDTVISEDHSHSTGDLGRLIEGKLQIVGRKKYSQLGFYNYLVDDGFLRANPKVKEAFSFAIDKQKYVVYRGVIANKIDGIVYKRVNKIPHDLKHKTKADYAKLIDIVNKH